ncbi:MAG: N-acetylmuramoyl-L-alanine amidase, partial [Spirochaetaceae bacterium]
MIFRMFARSFALLAFFFIILSPLFCADVELDVLLKETGARLEWNPLLQTGTMVSKVSQVVFSVGAPYLVVNGVQKICVEPVRRNGRRLVFPEPTAREIRQIFDEFSQPPRLFRVAAIVIDPGHGGRDSGASYVHNIGGKQVRVSEKDIVLTIAKKLQAMLVERYKDKVVLLTRDKDVYIPLEDRPYVANTIPAKPDEAIIYISLHANAS